MGHSRSLKTAEFDRSYMTVCQSATVWTALSWTIFQLLDTEECHDLEWSLEVTENDTIR